MITVCYHIQLGLGLQKQSWTVGKILSRSPAPQTHVTGPKAVLKHDESHDPKGNALGEISQIQEDKRAGQFYINLTQVI